MRIPLLTAITSATSTLTQFATSLELPWEQNGTPLFRKNMKKIYVDKTVTNENIMIPTLDHRNILEEEQVCSVYLAVDAKNPPTQLDSVVAKILGCRDLTGITNFVSESDYTVDKQEDVLIYTFEFRLSTITT